MASGSSTTLRRALRTASLFSQMIVGLNSQEPPTVAAAY